jgi:hypothetical protein
MAPIRTRITNARHKKRTGHIRHLDEGFKLGARDCLHLLNKRRRTQKRWFISWEQSWL